MVIYREEYKKYLINGTILKRTYYHRFSLEQDCPQRDSYVYKSIIEILGFPYIEYDQHGNPFLDVVSYRGIHDDGTVGKKSKYYVSDLFNGVVEVLNMGLFITKEEFNI